MAKRTVGLTDFYVYVLFRETGVPFYVGKGRGDRWTGHEKEAVAGAQNYRHRVIRKMQVSGLEIPKVKVHEGLTEQIAHAYEIALIAAIGRGKNGPLAKGRQLTSEHRIKLSLSKQGMRRKPSQKKYSVPGQSLLDI